MEDLGIIWDNGYFFARILAIIPRSKSHHALSGFSPQRIWRQTGHSDGFPWIESPIHKGSDWIPNPILNHSRGWLVGSHCSTPMDPDMGHFAKPKISTSRCRVYPVPDRLLFFPGREKKNSASPMIFPARTRADNQFGQNQSDQKASRGCCTHHKRKKLTNHWEQRCWSANKKVKIDYIVR